MCAQQWLNSGKRRNHYFWDRIKFVSKNTFCLTEVTNFSCQECSRLKKLEIKHTKINHSNPTIYISMGYTEHGYVLQCLMPEFEKEN